MTNEFGGISFVLHTRPYTDSRILVDLFDLTLGRCTAVARLSKRQARSGFEPFQALAVELGGRHELKYLQSAEAIGGRGYRLPGRLSFCGLYLNELLIRLLPLLQPNGAMFEAYEKCLGQLGSASQLLDAEPYLRRFEFTLISELGYGINWWASTDGCDIEADASYRFNGEEFVRHEDPGAAGPSARPPLIIPGEHLMALAASDYANREVRLSAKRLARFVLDSLLDGRPLKSRELFG